MTEFRETKEVSGDRKEIRRSWSPKESVSRRRGEQFCKGQLTGPLS